MMQPDDPGAGTVFRDPLRLVRYPNRAAVTTDPIPRKVFAYLESDFRVTVRGHDIVVPAGFDTDLASIPRRVRGIVSIDRGVEAAVVHDWLYRTAVVSRKEADLIFKALLEETESWATVQAMYWSVRVFGAASYSG